MMSFTNNYRYLFVFHNWYAQRIYKDPYLANTKSIATTSEIPYCCKSTEATGNGNQPKVPT